MGAGQGRSLQDRFQKVRGQIRPDAGQTRLDITGAMRRSILSIIRGMAVVFTSHLPYTALHNEGGNFGLTPLFNIGTKTTCPRFVLGIFEKSPVSQ